MHPRRELGAGGEAELDQHALDVPFRGPLGDHQPGRDLLVRQPFGDERRDLHVRQPGDVHRDVGPVSFTVVSFSPRFIDDEIGPVRLARTVDARDPRGAALHRLLDVALDGTTGLARDVAIAEALAALAGLDGPCTYTRAVRRAMALLRERVAEALTLDELAAHAGIDKYRLCRAFRTEVGLPPHAWLAELRIVRAKELLRAGTALRDIAPLVGFYDQSRLTKHFRRVVGTTPSRWRRGIEDPNAA